MSPSPCRYAVESIDAPPGTAEGTGRVTNVLEGWWMLAVTLTTVGYGDFSPQTAAGRVIAVFAMFLGLIVVAMPLSIVGDRFTQEWESRTMAIITEKFRVWLLHETKVCGAATPPSIKRRKTRR